MRCDSLARNAPVANCTRQIVPKLGLLSLAVCTGLLLVRLVSHEPLFCGITSAKDLVFVCTFECFGAYTRYYNVIEKNVH